VRQEKEEPTMATVARIAGGFLILFGLV